MGDLTLALQEMTLGLEKIEAALELNPCSVVSLCSLVGCTCSPGRGATSIYTPSHTHTHS